MSRIRSLHPEQWTDEEFVSCSPLARLLALGLRNEADDRGVFEWKPVALKMRLLPADDCDINRLLAELISTKQVSRFESEGKNYGAIRNFTKFQKPKAPKYRHPEPPGFPPKAEITPQMEEEDGEEGEGRTPKAPFVIDDEIREFARKHAALIADLDDELSKYRDWQLNNKKPKNERAGFRNWLRKANDFAAEKAAKEMLARSKGKAPLPGDAMPMQYNEPWPQRMKAWRASQFWDRQAYSSQPPGHPECRAPDEFLTPEEIAAKKRAA